MKKTIIYYLTLPVVLCISLIAQIKQVYAQSPGLPQPLYGVYQPTSQDIFISILRIVLIIFVPIAIIVLITLGIIKLAKRKAKDNLSSNVKKDSTDRQI